MPFRLVCRPHPLQDFENVLNEGFTVLDGLHLPGKMRDLQYFACSLRLSLRLEASNQRDKAIAIVLTVTKPCKTYLQALETNLW